MQKKGNEEKNSKKYFNSMFYLSKILLPRQCFLYLCAKSKIHWLCQK